MPIRINLLAETQALEEQRRRDPVKRVILVGLVLVAGMLAWSSSLMLKTMVVKSDQNRMESELNSRTNDYRQVLENKRKLADDYQKLAALHRLSTNRFLVGNFLDAFQEVSADGIQLVHLKLDLNYTVTEEVKGSKKAEGDEGAPAPAKPATSTEKISFAINAKDLSSTPGDAVNPFRESITTTPYFKQQLGDQNGIRLKSLSASQLDPEGKPFVLFALEANLPEKKR
ncbi:MAG: hypothetical protein U1F65_01565 [Verrucomicrobiota bacterium]